MLKSWFGITLGDVLDFIVIGCMAFICFIVVPAAVFAAIVVPCVWLAGWF